APAEGAAILTAGSPGAPPLAYHADLLEGQKTGFFLDHALNLDLAERLTLAMARSRGLRTVRVLDLFCYVGQWSARLAQALAREGIATDVTAVDASPRRWNWRSATSQPTAAG